MGGGCGFVEHGVVVKHASEFVEFPGDTDFGSVKVSFPLFHKRQPCVLSVFILDIATHHPQVPCFQIRLPFSDYDHLTKVLDKEIGSQVNKTQKLWVAPLHGAIQFSAQKPKPRDFTEGQWCPQQCVQQLCYVRATDCEERVPVYSLHSRHPQAWVEDLPGTTTPTKYTTGTILTLPLQSGPCFRGPRFPYPIGIWFPVAGKNGEKRGKTGENRGNLGGGGYFGQDPPTQLPPPLIILWGAFFANQIEAKALSRVRHPSPKG